MARKLERIDAKRLYTEELKEIPEIAIQINVPEATVYRWKNEDKEAGSDWDKEREAIRTTSSSAVSQMLLAAAAGMEEIVKELRTKGLAGFDSQKSFALSKLIRDAKSLKKDVDILGNIYIATREFIEFMNERDEDMLKQIQPLLQEFLSSMSNKYGRK
jgi:hypothetical protein